ncbi:MAG: hypothetical protein R2798_02395 [Chitinophagales bacterium]|nr:hypothetical protein [Bacteroidota bacterium]MCB9042177.1 hypothetical protein [Chitinophagales bacterium]
MNNTISLQYPTWFIFLCLLLGIAFALILYFRDRKFKEATSEFSRWLPFLAFLRGLGVFLIALLLLSPMLKRQFTDIKKPYILLLEDVSQSVGKFYKNDTTTLSQSLTQLQNQLSDNYEVRTYHFGENVAEGLNNNFDEKITDLSAALQAMNDRYAGQNVGAVILASDGIYNQGNNPIYTPWQLQAPVYTLALGDTTPQKDVRIDRALHNNIVYKNAKFMLRAEFSAINAQGSNLQLSVYEGKVNSGRKIFSKSYTAKNERAFFSEDIEIEAKELGIKEYTLAISPISGEENTQNNSQSIFVEVLEGKQKVIIVAASPHPDVMALRMLLDNNENIETEAFTGKNANPSIADADLLILHGLPSARNNAEALISQAQRSNIPIWFVLTAQTSAANFNVAQKMLQIKGSTQAMNDCKAIPAKDFNLFTIENNWWQVLENLPPLAVPYGEYAAGNNTAVLMNQKIGSVNTQYPLWILADANGYKSAVLCGEGLWRWKMYEYEKSNNNDILSALVNKVVQYLVVKSDKRKFKVNIAKKLLNENEKIRFDAELYNESYERINTPEASLEIRNSDGKDYPFVFSRTTDAYTLDAGILPPGDYTYTGQAQYNGQNYTASGNFTIKALEIERANTTANHQVLYSLSEKYGGKMLYPNETDSIVQLIKTNENIKPVMYNSYKSQAAINLRWIFGLLLVVFALEWFLRKYFGGY